LEIELFKLIGILAVSEANKPYCLKRIVLL